METSNLTAVTIGDSDTLRVGDPIYTEGNNLGELAFSQSSGAISGLDRTITAIDGRRVSVPSELEAVMKRCRAGESAELTVDRGGDIPKIALIFDSLQ